MFALKNSTSKKVVYYVKTMMIDEKLLYWLQFNELPEGGGLVMKVPCEMKL